ncbi:MAG: alpha/beta fold hydrolase [Ignavibacteria bacterium]|jgi:pimeloyl-ACP methyl ester carboxylesterase
MGENTVFVASDNEKINITSFGRENFQSNRFLIFVHGFKGFKDWGFNPYLGRYFADRGYYVVTFNFSHNGVGDDSLEFDELDKFAKNTFSREVRELKEIIEALKNNFFGEVDNPSIGLIGHSRGGAVALITANLVDDIKAVVTWASIAKLDRYSERQKKEWKEKGYFEVLNNRTQQLMRLDVDLLNDIEMNKNGSLNLEKSVAGLNKSLLLIHGDQDLAVPCEEANQLYEWSDKRNTELFIINKTGHTFDCKHPFEGSNEKFEMVLQKTNQFFNNSLI